MRNTVILVLALALAPIAHAGKERRDAERREAEDRKALEAAPADVVIGRPAGMDFLELPCPYTVGTTHSWRRTKVAKGLTTVSVVTASITAADTNQIDLDLTVQAESVDGEEGTPKQVQAALSAVGGTAKVRYHIPSSSMHLLNTDELQPAYTAAGKALAATLQDAGMPAVTAASTTREFTVAATLPKRLTSDLPVLFTNTCGSFALQPSSYESAVPSPTDGSPLPASGRMTTDRVNPTLVRFTNSQTVSAEALVPVVAQMLQQMGKPVQADADILAQLQAPGGGVSHQTATEVETATGKVQSASTTDTMKLADLDRNETVTFVAVP